MKAIKEKNRLEGQPNGADEVRVEIKPLNIQVIKLSIVGDTPLIVHAWSTKAVRMILDKQMKRAKQAKEAKNPVENFVESLHRMPDGSGYGIPAICFKKALVSVANIADLTKVDCRFSLHVLGHVGDMLKISAPSLQGPVTEWDKEYEKELQEFHSQGVSMRQDMVRIAMGTSDIRFRAQFPAWEIRDIPVRYNANVMSPEQIVNLAELAGFSNGLGEWRPQRDGSSGTFHVLKS